MKTSATIGATMTRNGTVPRPEAADLGPALGEPVGQVDDQRQLGDLGRVDGRQRSELQPARRAADHDVEARARTRARAGRPRRRRTAPTPGAGSGSRCASSTTIATMPEERPLDLRPDGRERVGVARQVAPERRRRVDHQDADRGQRDDHHEDHVVGLVALAPEGAGPALDRRPVGRRAIGRASRRLLGAARPARGAGSAVRGSSVASPSASRRRRRAATAALNARPRAA